MPIPERQFFERPAGPGRSLFGIAARMQRVRRRHRTGTSRDHTIPVPGARHRMDRTRRDPLLRWQDPSRVPGGAFAACALSNMALTTAVIPGRSDAWDVVSDFSLSYDGYAYWDDLPELANRSVQRWTRDRALPASVDEIRGCLFYEQRRWHHFGEEPHGRAAEYVWSLLDGLRELVAAA